MPTPKQLEALQNADKEYGDYCDAKAIVGQWLTPEEFKATRLLLCNHFHHSQWRRLWGLPPYRLHTRYLYALSKV